MNMSFDLNCILSNIEKMEENESLEFKEAATKIPKSFWETYSSFANTSGGWIILGVKDSFPHSIVGVNNPNKLVHEIFDNIHSRDKVSHNVLNNENISIETINGKSIVAVFVPELSINKKPLYLNNNLTRSYIRKNEGDYIATDEDLRRFIRNSHDNIDSELLTNYTIEDLDMESVLEFKNILNIREPQKKYLEMDNLEFLIEVGVFQIDRDDNRIPKLTLAGLIFLGKLPAIMQKLPHFHLDYINKRGDNSSRWKDRISTGDANYSNLNLFQYYKIVLEKLKLSIEDPFELDEKCVRKSSVELDVALREALANMIIHADYLDPETNIKVVTDNFYYTFSNPGTMKISKEQFFIGGQSSPRNTTLVLYFRRMGACERAGSGGKEIFNVVEKNKFRHPELSISSKGTFLKLWTAALENSYPEFSPETKKILLYIQDKREATISEIKTDTKLTEHYIRKALEELIEKKYIAIIGKGRATKYIWTPSKLEMIAAVDQYNKLVTTGRMQ